MALAEILVRIGVTVALMVGAATLLCVDHADLGRSLRDAEKRRAIAPYAGGLVGVLALNKVAREVGPEISWIIDWNITGLIHSVEGDAVAQLQDALATPLLTEYLSFMYIYGYVFLLTFPFVLYYALADTRPFRELAVAFGVNYTLGVLCYVLFVALGPRNLIRDLVTPFLYTTDPLSQLLTREVNASTNVFPSLHTSLSTTILLLAWRTRERYPLWLPIAALFGASITLATVYHGIHWITDVVAGVVLAVLSVAIAPRVVDRYESR